jgi:hypothetical protein
MRAKAISIGAACLVVAALSGHSGWAASSDKPVSAVTEQCERACLNGFVDQYLAALVAHDPSRLPLAKAVKFTENGQRLALGDGLWNTASGSGTYKLHVADVQAGQVGFFGTILENGKIRQIEAVLDQAPYGMDSGWSSWGDAMSSRAR